MVTLCPFIFQKNTNCLLRFLRFCLVEISSDGFEKKQSTYQAFFDVYQKRVLSCTFDLKTLAQFRVSILHRIYKNTSSSEKLKEQDK